MQELIDDPFLIGCIVIVIASVIFIAIVSYHHVHKAGFKPVFNAFSDGSVQMEFSGFGGIQTTRTKRFYEQYKVGMAVVYNGKTYTITDFQERVDASLLRTDIKMVAYLQEHN